MATGLLHSRHPSGGQTCGDNEEDIIPEPVYFRIDDLACSREIDYQMIETGEGEEDTSDTEMTEVMDLTAPPSQA